MLLASSAVREVKDTTLAASGFIWDVICVHPEGAIFPTCWMLRPVATVALSFLHRPINLIYHHENQAETNDGQSRKRRHLAASRRCALLLPGMRRKGGGRSDTVKPKPLLAITFPPFIREAREL